jgi:hypothetical protein
MEIPRLILVTVLLAFVPPSVVFAAATLATSGPKGRRHRTFMVDRFYDGANLLLDAQFRQGGGILSKVAGEER